MNRRCAAALFAALGCLPAQEDLQPLAPQVVLETVGPDGWRARLGPTNLGSLFASEDGRALWQPLVEPMLGAWAGMLGGEGAYRRASERIFGCGGVVRFAWRRSMEDVVSFAVVVDGDGRTDEDFGDADNDVPMLRRAGLGVAMGNAFPEVQAEAEDRELVAARAMRDALTPERWWRLKRAWMSAAFPMLGGGWGGNPENRLPRTARSTAQRH